MSINIFLIILSYPSNTIALFEPPVRFMTKWLVNEPDHWMDGKIGKLKDEKSRIDRKTFTGTAKTRIYYPGWVGSLKILRFAHATLVTLSTSDVLSSALDVFWFVYSTIGLFLDRNIPSSLMDGNENAMTFGQIVPILLLSSTIFVFREACEDSRSCLSQLRRR